MLKILNGSSRFGAPLNAQEAMLLNELIKHTYIFTDNKYEKYALVCLTPTNASTSTLTLTPISHHLSIMNHRV
jgi:hypothetical protein